MKIYTLIAGVNGVGKSSFTGVLRTQKTDLGKIIDVDRLIAQCGGNAIEGGKKALTLIDDCLEKGICFTQETTLSGHRILSNVRQANEKGYVIRLYYIGLDTAQESIWRIRNRVRKGGHSIPEQDVRRRFEKRFENLSRILPYCSEAEFYDNENGFREVGAYRNGDLILMGDDRPEWIQELGRYLGSQERGDGENGSLGGR